VLEIIEARGRRIIFQRCKMSRPDCEHAVGAGIMWIILSGPGTASRTPVIATTLADLIQQQEKIDLTRLNPPR